MLVQKNVQQFIKGDCETAIGSAGIVGDRILIITQGSSDAPPAKTENTFVERTSRNGCNNGKSLQVTATNAALVSSSTCRKY